MDLDAVSPKSQPLPQTFQIPALWLPDPLILTPAKSRESSISTACMEDSWPPKWAPPPDRATTPPSSYDDLSNPTSDMPERTPQTGAQGHDYIDPRSKSWQATNPPPSSIRDPLTTALTNARKTTTTLDALSSLLATLLTAQTPSSCPTQLPHDPSANTNTNPALTDARILQILLSLHPTLDHSPAGLHALHRLCMHGSHTAAADLAALQDRPSASARRVARFVAKWGGGAFPERAFDGVQCGGGVDGARTLPPGEAGEISVAGCLDFVAAFAKGWAGRRGVCVRGVWSGVGRVCRRLLVCDGGVGRDRGGARDGSSSSSGEGSDRLVERCRGNIEHVLRLLGHVAAELDVEIWRRRRRVLCARFLTDGCWRVGGEGEEEEEEEEVWVARGEIERVVVEVGRDKEALAGWEGSGVEAGIWGGKWDVNGNGRRSQGKARLLRQWLCLSERKGGWGWGLVMRADEIVRRIGVGKWVDFGGGGGEKRVGLKSW